MTEARTELVPPYWGQGGGPGILTEQGEALMKWEVNQCPMFQISDRRDCDMESLAVGFSPLDRFLGQAGYQRIFIEMRLADGARFSLSLSR